MAEENTSEEKPAIAAAAASAVEDSQQVEGEPAKVEETEVLLSPAEEEKDPPAAAPVAAEEETAADDPTEQETTKAGEKDGGDDGAPSITQEEVSDTAKATSESIVPAPVDETPPVAMAAVEQGTFGVAVGAATATAPETEAPLVEDETKKEEEETVFVNRGLAAWEQSRQQWLNHKKEGDRGREPPRQQRSNNPHAVPVNVDEIIDVVFASPRQLRANGGKGRHFPQPVALPQMIDILQDLWEAEGLDV